MKRITLLFLSAILPLGMNAQTLTLEDCRQMAIESNKDLIQSRTKVEMAGYDRKIALANYFPNISATGAYTYNSQEIVLVDQETSATMQNLGTAFSQSLSGSLQEMIGTIMATDPAYAQKLMTDPMFQMAMKKVQSGEIAGTINQIGSEIESHMHLDIENMFVGAVSLQQPVFMGGKIVAANRIAKLAEELAQSQYDQQYQQTVIDVDQAYWQIVSVAAKKELAESYADLLHKMEKDVEISISEGIATESDGLQIKVKANEADMMKTKAINGLSLAKMLLCKQIGLPLDSQITLADEGLDSVRIPTLSEEKDMEQIFLDRPETRSLELASQIYENKVNVARADMLPKIALTANYLVSNPNPYNGFSKEWGGMFNAGVMVSVPIFHGFEALQKTRKAKAEATLYKAQYDNAKDLISLQVSQLRKQQGEALEKLQMAQNNLESAEENLRKATIGFEEGVTDANVALAAQTAWLQAHSEYIDAGIELQMNFSELQKAEGNNKSNR